MKTNKPHASRSNETKEVIDFVVPWVDGSDNEWRALKNKYLKAESRNDIDGSDKRYRDLGVLKYWFRGVEKYTPWVNKVYFVTSGQLPDWINLNAKKLVWVKHEDYIPEEYLPTFSSNPIEINMHRIPGLADKFVYFNDDTFILRQLNVEHFFLNGLPVMSPLVSLTVPKEGINQHAHVLLNCVMTINEHFEARKVICKNVKKWISPTKLGIKSSLRNCLPLILGYFPGFKLPHLPAPFLRSTLCEVWEEEENQLTDTSKHRFRSNNDLTQYLFTEWQLATGMFIPKKENRLGQYYELNDKQSVIDQITDVIQFQKQPTICINDVLDNVTDQKFQNISDAVIEAFEKILPEKSSFEK